VASSRYFRYTSACCRGPGLIHEGTAFTRDETRALKKLYGFKPEEMPAKLPKPVLRIDPNAPSYEKTEAERNHREAVALWENQDPRDSQNFMQTGADRNLARHVDHDGRRLCGWLAKFVPAGEDPLKTLVWLAIAAGWDVDPEDVAWVER
jgi:hypothetical protein